MKNKNKKQKDTFNLLVSKNWESKWRNNAIESNLKYSNFILNYCSN